MACGIKNGNKESPIKFGGEVLKIIVMGEARCGKTTFIRQFVSEYNPGPETSINGVKVYPCEFEVHNEMREVAVYEIPSDPRFLMAQKRPHYEMACLMVFMYAIDDPASLQMLSNRWIPETGPIIQAKLISVALLGNKKDLRSNQQVIDRLALNGQVPVTPEQTEGLFDENVDCPPTIETSSINPDEVSDAVTRIRDRIYPVYYL